MIQTQKQRPDHLPGCAPADLLWAALKLAGALGFALAMAAWVNSLLAQI